MQTNDGRLIVVAGSSRSGKTVWTVRAVKKSARLLVWDIEDQWSRLPGFRRITSRADLLKICTSHAGPIRAAYVAGGDVRAEFDFFAGCAQYWRRYHGAADIVAEELADVTTPAKAPGNWGILLRRGLKRGGDIYCISQRWAEADKTAVGNASEFILFRMSSGDDIAYMSRKTRVPAEDLAGLKPLEFVRFDAATGEKSKGKLRF